MLDRHRRPGFLLAVSLLADQGADFAPEGAANDHVAHAQRAFAHQHRGGRAAGFEARFDDVAFGAAVGVGLEFQQVGLKQNHFQQLVHPLLGQGRNIDENRLAAPFVGHQALLLQLLPHLHRVGVGVIALVDSDEDGRLRRLRVAQALPASAA